MSLLKSIDAEKVLANALAKGGDFAEIYIEDNANTSVICEDDKIENIFELLVTWKPGGMGMGLAISNSIIESHGGRLWAENRREGGARIGFTLPVSIKGEKS